MITEKKRCARIMKEIVGYFLDNDLPDFKMEFKMQDGTFRLYVEAESTQEPANFQQLLQQLNTDRQIELDEYYNALLGGNSHGHEPDYSFLGKAIDLAEGRFENGRLSLLIVRYETY